MAINEGGALARMFRHFADAEFRGYSPRYEHLSLAVAERPALAAPLLAAPPGQRRAILYFAAVQYLLRRVAPDHPLAAYLPTLGGRRPVDDRMVAALADLVRDHGDDLAALCASRTAQTNEAARAALLRPGFGRAVELADGRPLALLELGTSAGLLLLTDRYACRYRTATAPDDGSGSAAGPGPDDGARAGSPGREEIYGPVEAAAVTVDCEVRGARWPEPAARPLRVADRIGVDLHPVDIADAAATDWLRACVWPERTDRLARLDAALAQVATVRPRLVAADMVDALPDLVRGLGAGVLPCVFASNALTYLPEVERHRLVATLAGLGAERDLVVVLNEASRCGAELFVAGRPAEAGPPGMLAVGLLTLVSWRAGEAGVEVLARTGPHGQWLTWCPRRYPYAPPS